MSSAKENIAKCPEFCWSVNNVTLKLIKIKAGESGYYPQSNTPDDKQLEYMYNIDPTVSRKARVEVMDLVADGLNEMLGINRGQREAMEIGAMMGWEVPGANPDHYNEDGSYKKEFLTK